MRKRVEIRALVILVFLIQYPFSRVLGECKLAYFEKVAEFRKLEKLWIRKALDAYNVFYYIGDIKDKSVLDLGCGSGYYSSLFLNGRASKVVGVDSSKQMIDIAREKAKDVSNLIYYIDDATGLKNELGQFDVVTAIFLFNQAASIDALGKMFRTVYRSMKPDGIFIGLTNNLFPGQMNTQKGYYKKYDFDVVYRTPIANGSLVDFWIEDEHGKQVDLVSYHYSYETYLQAIKKAGFSQIEILPMVISPQSAETMGERFWLDYRAKPNSVVLRLHK